MGMRDTKGGCRNQISFEHHKVHEEKLFSVSNSPTSGTLNYIFIDMSAARTDLHMRFRVSSSGATFAQVRLFRVSDAATLNGGFLVEPVCYNRNKLSFDNGAVFTRQWTTISNEGTPFFVKQWVTGTSAGSTGEQIDPEWVLIPPEKYKMILTASGGSPTVEIELAFYES